MNQNKESISVIIAVETCIYREGISQLLEKCADVVVVSEVARCDAVISACNDFFEESTFNDTSEGDTKPNANVLLLDATMPGVIDLVNDVHTNFPHTHIVMLSMRASKQEMSLFAAKGCQEFVSRDDSFDDLRHCIEAAINNGFWCSNRIAKLLFNDDSVQSSYQGNSLFDDDLGVLTRRQTKVLNLLGTGLSNKEIARNLNIETNTVKNHVHQILQKLHVSTRREAAAKIQKNCNGFIN